MNEKILEALAKLDTSVDSQWTKDGEVNLSAFKFMMGGEAVTREQLEAVAPGFNRSNPNVVEAKDATEETTQDSTAQLGNVATEEEQAPGKYEGTIKVLIGAEVSEEFKNLIRTACGFKELDNVSEATDEELEEIYQTQHALREQASQLQNLITSVVNERYAFIDSVILEREKRTPKETLADKLRASREELLKSVGTLPIDQPRARVQQAPVLRNRK